MLKVKFLGAIKGVTGSCSWLWHTDSDTQLLVDCGMHQGVHELEWLNSKDFSEFNPKEIQYVILTHAHIDHCGLLPKLIREGFKGWVYCTEATRDIAREMLLDSAKISGLYTPEDVKKLTWHVIDRDNFRWSQQFRLAKDLSVTFLRGSHVLGGCSVSIAWALQQGDAQKDFKSIHFSGDIGCQRDANPYLPLLKPDHEPYATASYIVTESTYGNRIRETQSWEKRIDALTAAIDRTLNQKGGKVLIPTFAFHRMQELMADLSIVNIPTNQARALRVTCHSPLGIKLNAIYGDQLQKKLENGKYQYLNPELPSRLNASEGEICKLYSDLAKLGKSALNNTLFSTPSKERKASADEHRQATIDDSDVILATSGMCDNGPSVKYLEAMASDPNNTIIITGFQAHGSAGRRILESEYDGSTAEVIDMSSYYSAHADQSLLLNYLLGVGKFKEQDNGATVFINHGTDESKQALKSALLSKSKSNDARTINEVHIANSNWYDLNKGAFMETHSDTISKVEELEERNRQLIERLREAGLEPSS